MASLSKGIELLKNIEKFLTHDLWHLDFSQLSNVRVFFYRQIRIIYVVVRAFSHDRLTMRASALVYTTLLSIVPLLAVVFSVLKAFGVYNKLESTLTKLLWPLGEQAVNTIVPPIVEFVENANAGALGAVGLLALFFAVLSIFNNIERAFNDIWKVQQTRRMHRKVTDYLSIILVGPILVFAILGVTASLQSNTLVRYIQNIPAMSFLFSKASPYVISWCVFLFAYLVVPNTHVRFTSALSGAIIAGTLWQIMNWIFAHFVVYSYQFGSKAALYASFVTLPLFLLWLYLSWSVVLLGAEIAYAHQHVETFLWEQKIGPFSIAYREEVALKILLIISKRFVLGSEGPSSTELTTEIGAPVRLVNELLTELKLSRLINEVNGDSSRFTPAVDLETLSLDKVLSAYRNHGLSGAENVANSEISAAVAKIQNELQKFTANQLGNKSLRTVVQEILARESKS